ncbi:L,D-transpeptidase family protein [Szabonella alba]|uniref:L,D-transpeptidase family protein n=1 Tax=Szabonella alba TaxID=2804194 RepID=A0A8K0Y2L4_9RHOB|nr:L,D-transpeptidase family protein [Szabonella alba]
MHPGTILATRWGVQFAGRRLAASIGRGGIVPAAQKCEGDGATPAGLHRIVGMLFRPDRIAPARLPGWAVPIGPRDLWSDDLRDPAYNHPVRAPHPFGHERLSRPDPLYDLILLTDWNHPDAVPGRGSAIFVHTWRRPRHPTAGCLAFSRPDLLWLAARIRPGTTLEIRGWKSGASAPARPKTPPPSS